MSKGNQILLRKYPEVKAGGFSRCDGTIEFYTRVNALLNRESVVVDFGAGRGEGAHDQNEFRRDLRALRGKVSRVIGVDVDQAVVGNPLVDESIVVKPSEEVGLDENSVDLIVSDFTFEHISDPGWVARNFSRILRPNGWICVRTPNRWGTIGMPTRLVPNRFHNHILRRVQPLKAEQDTFPTRYRLNTMREVRRWFPQSEYENSSYYFDSEPAYAGNSVIGWKALSLAMAAAPPPMRSTLMIFLRKR